MPGKARKSTQKLSREERERRLNRAYGKASQELRDRYRDEFNQLYGEAAREEGVDWKPRLRPEEKAEQELLTIFEAWPDLREKYAADQAQADQEPEPEPAPEPEGPEDSEPGPEGDEDVDEGEDDEDGEEEAEGEEEEGEDEDEDGGDTAG